MPKLADTLEKVAEDPFTFYNGSLANDTVNDIAEQGRNQSALTVVSKDH